MRKNSVFFLGAVAGTCLTLVVAGPRSEFWVAAARAATSAQIYSQLNLFGDVFERVKADYVEKPDDGKLIEGAINGMITSLDPHSRYMNEQAWRDMQETTHGEFGGLGIEVTMEDGLVKVVSPMDGTPAAKAGVMSGDLITSIDGDAVQGLTLEQAVNKMKGPVHTSTKLKIERKGADKPIDVTIQREIIQVKPVSFHTDWRRHRLHPDQLVQRADHRRVAQGGCGHHQGDPARQARRLRSRSAQQSRRPARPGGVGVRHVPVRAARWSRRAAGRPRRPSVTRRAPAT